MNKHPLMKCGHVAQGENSEGKPCCVICFPDVESQIVDEEAPDLTGREAKCSECGRIVPSSYDLPFFEHRPDHEFDDYYNGCRGWD